MASAIPEHGYNRYRYRDRRQTKKHECPPPCRELAPSCNDRVARGLPFHGTLQVLCGPYFSDEPVSSAWERVNESRFGRGVVLMIPYEVDFFFLTGLRMY